MNWDGRFGKRLEGRSESSFVKRGVCDWFGVGKLGSESVLWVDEIPSVPKWANDNCFGVQRRTRRV